MVERGRPGTVLLVEDDEAERNAVAAVVREAGHSVATAGSGREALAFLERRAADVVVLDLGLPDVDGLDLLPRLVSVEGNATVVVLTGRDDIQTVVEAMKRGADGFLVKPVDVATLQATVEKALRQQRLVRRATVYEEAVAARKSFGELGAAEFVGSSPLIRAVREMIGQVAATDSSVVLSGESGTGKGVVARLIHRYSRRPHGPFVGVSCAALPSNLVESEIFGHERGAFTDAKTSKPGLLEVANGGTVFLDEVAELEAPAQGKLLKVIEERSFRRLGGVRDLSVDVRFVVATHQDLAELVRRGAFRPGRVPPGPLLPTQRVPDRAAAAARARRRRTRAHAPVHQRPEPHRGARRSQGDGSGRRAPPAVLLARERARAAQRDRAGDDPGGGG
ncbi:MAG: hypothetical protein B7X11_01980 [Acidobacteria bacterium 37-65-4]|nr:MAG: hypothetical protein B7X11_01980 [Acidobacteria bacterium 37-65-4]